MEPSRRSQGSVASSFYSRRSLKALAGTRPHNTSDEKTPSGLDVDLKQGPIQSQIGMKPQDKAFMSSCSGVDVGAESSSSLSSDRSPLIARRLDVGASRAESSCGVVNTLRQYIAHQDKQEKGSPTSTVMRVKYSKNNKANKRSPPIYPYGSMKEGDFSYRGYTMNGPDDLKRSKKWKIQIVGASLGPPPEPLPQFPQQELLSRANGEYFGAKQMELTEEQVAWNSGVRYLANEKCRPTSAFFFTSGYRPGSAVVVEKPFPESIYETVVKGVVVEVSKSRYK